jgi:hypothetical protein
VNYENRPERRYYKMNKTIVFALALLIGSVFAGSGFAQTDSAASSVYAQKAVAVSPSIKIVPPIGGSPEGPYSWSGTINAGRDDIYYISFSTARVTPSTSNNIKDKEMNVGVVNLYKGSKQGELTLYKIVQNNNVVAQGTSSYWVLPIGAVFSTIDEAKAQSLGVITFKIRDTATASTAGKRAGMLLYLNRENSPLVGKILTGEISYGQNRITPATNSVEAQPVRNVKVSLASPSLIARIRAFFIR